MAVAPSSSSPTIVVGAGPHGLSAVAHLRAAGVPTRAFGRPLEFWRAQMPEQMLLRSSPRASSIADPGNVLRLSDWSAHTGREIGRVVPIGDFIEYGTWFADRVVPDLDHRDVVDVRKVGDGFVVTLDDGEECAASRVVIAVGLGPFPHVPPVFSGLPQTLVSHTADTVDLAAFGGRSVAVIGSGQSALESAAILSECGASVDVIGRAESIFWLGGWRPAGEATAVPTEQAQAKQTFRARHGLHWRPAPTDVGGRLESWVGAAPDVCHLLPRTARAPLTAHCIRPAGASWLPDRLRDVQITLGANIVSAQEHEEGVQLKLGDGTTRRYGHILLGTGYSIDVRRYSFFADELAGKLKMLDGSPQLSNGLESSVPGLHFTGAPAAASFGPVMRFVIGTSYTGAAVTDGVSGRRRKPFRWAF